jgi:hypothetical protein
VRAVQEMVVDKVERDWILQQLRRIERLEMGDLMYTWSEIWKIYVGAFDMFLEAIDKTVRKAEWELKIIYKTLKRFTHDVIEAMKKPVERYP